MPCPDALKTKQRRIDEVASDILRASLSIGGAAGSTRHWADGEYVGGNNASRTLETLINKFRAKSFGADKYE